MKQTLKLLANQLKTIQGFERAEIKHLHARNNELQLALTQNRTKISGLERLLAKKDSVELSKAKRKSGIRNGYKKPESLSFKS